MKLIVYTDWWSRWNPWSAGLWVAIYDESMNKLEGRYKSLWVMTNNEAEYLWAFYGVKRAIELWATHIELNMDSNLVIKQLEWEWKIKKEELRVINLDIKKMIADANVTTEFIWVPREKNKEADRLSNIAMDNN